MQFSGFLYIQKYTAITLIHFQDIFYHHRNSPAPIKTLVLSAIMSSGKIAAREAIRAVFIKGHLGTMWKWYPVQGGKWKCWPG